MPRYLLNLTTIDIENPELFKIRVVEASQDVKYLCLSYCWGSPSPSNLTLSKANKHQFFTVGIPQESMPQAFRDAIILLAKLGYPYLWIDTLCIVQDDLQRRAEEIERMGTIYANCDFVIANVHANSPTKDCSILPKLIERWDIQLRNSAALVALLLFAVCSHILSTRFIQ
jgi:hypothetical protein